MSNFIINIPMYAKRIKINPTEAKMCYSLLPVYSKDLVNLTYRTTTFQESSNVHV